MQRRCCMSAWCRRNGAVHAERRARRVQLRCRTSTAAVSGAGATPPHRQRCSGHSSSNRSDRLCRRVPRRTERRRSERQRPLPEQRRDAQRKVAFHRRRLSAGFLGRGRRPSVRDGDRQGPTGSVSQTANRSGRGRISPARRLQPTTTVSSTCGCNGGASCHASSAGGNLVMPNQAGAYAALVGVEAMGAASSGMTPSCADANVIRVVAGDSDASLLVNRVEQAMPKCGIRMPPGGQ